MKKIDEERLDKALALLWAVHANEGRPPWEHANDGTRARTLAKLLDQLIAQLQKKRRALARPFSRNSAKILARVLSFDVDDRYDHCAGDIEEDLIDAGEAVEMAAKRRGNWYENQTRMRKDR